MKACIRNWTSVCFVCVWRSEGDLPSLFSPSLAEARSCLLLFATLTGQQTLRSSLCLPSHRRNIGITDRPFHAWRCMGPGIQFQASYCKASTCCTELHSHPLSSHFKIQKLSKTGLFSVFTQTVHNRRGLKPANWLATFFLWVVIWRT